MQMASANGETSRRVTINFIKMARHASHPTRRARVTRCVGVHTEEPVLTASPVASPDHMSQIRRGKSCDNTDPPLPPPLTPVRQVDTREY